MKFKEKHLAEDIILKETAYLPKEVFLRELELVRTTISFLTKDKELALNKIRSLPISEEIKVALKRLSDKGLLHWLQKEAGAELINRIRNKLNLVAELMLVVPVELDKKFKEEISKKLSVFKKRVVFRVDSSLVAGVIFVEGGKVVDYSIQNNIKPFLRIFYNKKL